MRILICSLEAPLPPVNGLRLQVSALTNVLRDGHDVQVVAFRMPDQDAGEDHDGVRLVDWTGGGPTAKAASLIRSTVRRRPFGIDELVTGLGAQLAQEAKRFDPDVVHVTPGRLAGLSAQLEGRARVLAALDAAYLNIEAKRLVAAGLERALLRSQVARMRRFEATAYRSFHKVVVVSQEDGAALERIDGTLDVSVIPNGVDLDAFSPPPGVERESGLIIFTGVMSYPPNVAAAEYLARRLLPRVQAVCAGARLALVGRSPDERVRALGELQGVHVVGEVPQMAAWLARGWVYACPMQSGTGIKNKLLEALANGLPCVITPLALQGLDAEPGRDLLVGGDAEELAAQLTLVLANPQTAQALGRAGREYVRSHHSWRAVGRAYERVYSQAVARSEAVGAGRPVRG